MSQLPLQLSCLTLAHIVDDVDAVEGYLAHDPEAAKCFPIILRDVIFNNEINEEYGLSKRGLPDTATTLKYLTALWNGGIAIYSTLGRKAEHIIIAAALGATYLIPYLVNELPKDYSSGYKEIILTDALSFAQDP